MQEQRTDPRESRFSAAGFAVLALLLVWSIFAVPYIPSNDGPESILAVHIDNHYSDPSAPLYRAVFLPALQYASRGFTVLFGPLEDWLGWRRGLQVALAIITLATAWGFYSLVSAVDRRRLALAFLGFPLALTWELYMGFYAFAVGSAVGLFAIAWAVRWRTPVRLQQVCLALLLLMEAFCHVFSAVLTGLVLGALLLLRAPRGRRLAAVAQLTLIGAPAATLLAISLSNRGALKAIPFADDYATLPLDVTSLAFPRIVAPGPWWRAVVVVALVLATLTIGAVRARRASLAPTDLAFLVSGTVLLLAGFFAPIQIPGWQYFSQRFVPLGTLAVLLTLPIESVAERSVRTAVKSALFFFSATYLAASSGLHRRLAATCADEIAGLGAPVVRHGVWLPVVLSPNGGMSLNLLTSEVPYLAPMWHMPALYAVVEGGLTPYTFANNAATFPIIIRADGLKPPIVPPRVKYSEAIGSDSFATDPTYRRRVQDELAIYGTYYEGVLVLDALPRDIAQWRARGYEVDWTKGSVLIAHFDPCPLDVVLPDGAERAPLLDLGIGETTVFRDETLPLEHDAEGRSHVHLPRSPCGEVWVRPHWDTSSDGRVDHEYCANAGAEGKVSATLTRARPFATCTRAAAGTVP